MDVDARRARADRMAEDPRFQLGGRQEDEEQRGGRVQGGGPGGVRQVSGRHRRRGARDHRGQHAGRVLRRAEARGPQDGQHLDRLRAGIQPVRRTQGYFDLADSKGGSLDRIMKTITVSDQC